MTPPRPTAPFRRAALSTTLALIAAATIVAWQPAYAADPTPPTPVVQVASVVQRAVEPTAPQVGRLEAAQRVELRPRVAGQLQAVLFREGELVRAGQPLFRIDPRPFDASVDRARAELQLATARERLANAESERARQLLQERAIATEEAERRAAAHAEAQARVAAAQATLQSASLDREFAVVTAPIAGRIGRANITAGNYVAAGATQPPLATLTAMAPLHVHFDLGDSALVAQLAGQRKAAGWHAKVIDPRNGALVATAPLDFIDNEVAAQSGTLRLRARIDQPPAQLLPGQFVRVQLGGAAREALLVPEQAIGTDQGQRYVLVVKDGQLEYRKVRLGAAQGAQRVIAHGLQAGEQVVVSGLMKLRPGMKVQPQPAGADAAAQSAAPAHKS
jgi:multidrug efflux system membrane fusion protein